MDWEVCFQYCNWLVLQAVVVGFVHNLHTVQGAGVGEVHCSFLPICFWVFRVCALILGGLLGLHMNCCIDSHDFVGGFDADVGGGDVALGPVVGCILELGEDYIDKEEEVGGR